MRGIRHVLMGHAALMALAAETGAGTGAPSAPAQQRPTSGTAPTTGAPSAPKPPRPAETKPADATRTEASPASGSSDPTPASPEAPAAEGEAPKRRGRPPGSGTGTAAAPKEPKPETPPSEMGMGALLREAVKAAGKVKTRTAELVEASDALAELTTEMQKRLQ